ncbi:MAG TPA: TAT-variant-translocated molybdopterin oxidoreductase [Pirellulaceae bacterium]|nr:TAT-variant-translocated molybdopterin oxidoreductase [Pirellulaceae bacterium]
MTDSTHAFDAQTTVPAGVRFARSGPSYWRSLEEYAQTPEFEELLHREFPSQLDQWNDPIGRRRFLTLMAASLAFGGIAGCTRPPQETIVPYVKAPEEIVPGKPLFYATAMPRGGYALGLLVESHLGRPTKIEGNPEHPSSLGATDAIAQASILSLYDPDRSQTVMHRGAISTWDKFMTEMAAQREKLVASRGAGLRILTETVTSPTLSGQLRVLLEELPEARWHQYDPSARDNVRLGARQAFGQDADVVYSFDKADVVLSLDADFLLAFPGSVRYARDFIDRRRVSSGKADMNRLYVVESTPTITGAMAEHRLPLRPSQIEPLARAIAGRLGIERSASAVKLPAGVSEAWLNAVVKDLEEHRGTSLVIAGDGQPPAVHALVHAINGALENVGQSLSYIQPVEAQPVIHHQSLVELLADMEGGRVETLVILGGNPVYSAPSRLGFADKLKQVARKIHLSEYDDETSFLCDWHIPAAHYLESWSDARAFDGTATILQPLIAPLYGGKTAHEVLAVLRGRTGRTSFEIVQAHWRQEMDDDQFGTAWRKAVHDGVLRAAERIDPSRFRVEASGGIGRRPQPEAQTGSGTVEVEFRLDAALGDGSLANNGWLQELPKPLSKIVWDNVASLSAATAQRLGVENGDVVEITLDGRSLRGPVWIAPGQPDDCLSLTLGYGRTRSGRVGNGVGYRAAEIMPADGARFAVGASVRRTGEKHPISTTQSHHAMEGRDIVRVTMHQRVTDDSQSATPHSDELPSLYPEYEYTGNAWGMVIDQTACIGCNACVVACQAENNIPIVGKEQVAVGREMHWLRIDRYHVGGLDNPETYFQPMMCVHCEKAPCEVVCPVAATVHDSEGTSNMIYNRCVGTRYCSNNCPYKVRRFNYLQYTDETTPSLKLLRNPDVTVRSRGVMEKCSYCIQRISAGRIAAKIENRPIADGEVVTACQQACPTRAIVFGNLNDPQSQVRRLKESPLNYGVLAELNTVPRTTYLARVTNPHPDLPMPAAAELHGEPKVHADPNKAES